ncbi:MAG: hypothetical protein WBE26_01840 [Phycisphaerae bacterium]
MKHLLAIIGLALVLSPPALGQTARIQGYIYPGVEMGCWMLDDADTGITYELYGGDPFLHQEGFWALIWGTPHPEWDTYCMQGTPFEVFEGWLIWFWPPETCTITPQDPTPADPVTITMAGNWPDSCIPNDFRVGIEENTIDFNVVVDYPQGTACFDRPTPWSLSATIDPLAPGAYSVKVALDMSDSFNLGLAGPPDFCTFTVETSGPVPEWSFPMNCTIDARQPHDPDGSNPRGWFVIDLYYWMVEPDLDRADFTVTQVGGQNPPPSVAAVLPIPSITEDVIRRVVLSRYIEPGTWTTLTHNESGYSVSVGYLPGDVNGDGTAGPEDILALIDRLNSGYHPHFLHWMCDADRSGMCAPADMLRVIDLFNGANAYDAWLGRTLPSCPSE